MFTFLRNIDSYIFPRSLTLRNGYWLDFLHFNLDNTSQSSCASSCEVYAMIMALPSEAFKERWSTHSQPWVCSSIPAAQSSSHYFSRGQRSRLPSGGSLTPACSRNNAAGLTIWSHRRFLLPTLRNGRERLERGSKVMRLAEKR